jgi:hypothetical protein
VGSTRLALAWVWVRSGSAPPPHPLNYLEWLGCKHFNGILVHNGPQPSSAPFTTHTLLTKPPSLPTHSKVGVGDARGVQAEVPLTLPTNGRPTLTLVRGLSRHSD